MAHRTPTADVLDPRGYRRLVPLHTWVLPGVAADVSRERSWLLGSGAGAVVADLRDRRLLERDRWRGGRLARAQVRPQTRASCAWCVRVGHGRRVHVGDDS